MGFNDRTTWRDERLVPRDYDDVANLVSVAREVGNRVVEFDRSFAPEDLRSFRVVATGWGRKYQGRYRCFAARVVAAINAALDDPHSVYCVNEPQGAKGLDCLVRCKARDGCLRLHGHAPFNVIFGYVHAVTVDDPASRSRLGGAGCATIENAARALGWDPERLAEGRLRPFWNALFGFALGYGVVQLPPPSGPATTVAIDLRGPFAAVEGTGARCLFTDPVAGQSGVYLWTIDVGGQQRPYYVGQTRRAFGQRMAEHISAFLSGQYDTLDLGALDRGELRAAWRAGASGLGWPQDLPRFLGRPAEHVRAAVEMIHRLRFHVAVVDGDEHLHDRIEGAIGRHLKQHQDRSVSDFFGTGIKLPAKVPNDKPLRLVLTSDVPLAGMPAEITE